MSRPPPNPWGSPAPQFGYSGQPYSQHNMQYGNVPPAQFGSPYNQTPFTGHASQTPYNGQPPQRPASYFAPPQFAAPSAPPSERPWTGAEPTVDQMFQIADPNGSGRVTAASVRSMLRNVAKMNFSEEVVKILVKTFDLNGSDSLEEHEFAGLWKYLSDWRAVFQKFDADRSGTISANELGKAYEAFGYRMTDAVLQTLIKRFGDKHSGALDFDSFIRSCIVVRNLSERFKALDAQCTGFAKLSYHDFLVIVLESI